MTPREVLEATKQIERELGRTRKSSNGQYADRPIDIDILLYDDIQVNEPDLVIPHPHMEEREFVMIPLQEIRPEKQGEALLSTTKVFLFREKNLCCYHTLKRGINLLRQ